jgi:hypothetical protein
VNDPGDITALVEAIGELPGSAAAPPAPPRELDRLEAFAGVRLPEPHRSLLLHANGISTSWGYQRLFGVGDGCHDMGPWNAHETWKFAWPRALDDFLAIGQTGWGDQFAYSLSGLRVGDETIHRLDRVLMEKSDPAVAANFGEFLTGFLDSARNPSERVHEARRQVGDLRPDELAVFWPSPLLVSLERATQLMRMNARAAMVVNGDLATQLLEPANESRQIDRFDTFLDNRGRSRIHVRWSWRPDPEMDLAAMNLVEVADE